MSSFYNIGPEELGLLSAIIGVGVAAKLNDEEQNSVGNFLVSIGSIILTISAQGELLSSDEKDKEAQELQNRISSLEKQIAMIEQKLR